ncbi:tumor suppressor candidate 2 [Eurytemora carolleeae]|uniref:tumor suppressor candidate 2 n=1 Tax=Eurytemora carolleeae TaxID=1294199 RepID=UPI000C788A73|nr:tumor suppressor candidate 2 [Eurytemora carolleeae]|eukprot:XP_023322771.1 tumor suppressor candidate 2-like [Eurytemora affinis]
MGQTGSRLVNKLSSSFTYHGSPSEEFNFEDADRVVASFKGGTPFVYSRQGSMYFDEDGDLAHEFYEEVAARKRGGKRRMRRIDKNLRPQGEVKYRVPCLNVDFPIVLYSD